VEGLETESDQNEGARNREKNSSCFSSLLEEEEEEDDDEDDDEGALADAADNFQQPELDGNNCDEELSSEDERSDTVGEHSDIEPERMSLQSILFVFALVTTLLYLDEEAQPAVATPEEVDEDEFEEIFSISERTRARVLNRNEIIVLLTTVTTALKISPQDRHNGRVCVGMVGYPNVGKSSVINTILGVSRASHGNVNILFSGQFFPRQYCSIELNLMLCVRY
jgi:hypothetical protein